MNKLIMKIDKIILCNNQTKVMLINFKVFDDLLDLHQI